MYGALSYLKNNYFALPGKENEAIHFHLTLDWHVWQDLSLIQTHLSVSWGDFRDPDQKSKNLTFCIRFDFLTFNSAKNSVLHLRPSTHILCLFLSLFPCCLITGKLLGRERGTVWSFSLSPWIFSHPDSLVAFYFIHRIHPPSVCAHVGDQELMSP